MTCLAGRRLSIHLVTGLLCVIHRQARQRLALPCFLRCFGHVVGPQHHDLVALCMAQCLISCSHFTFHFRSPALFIFTKCGETLCAQVPVSLIDLLELTREMWPHRYYEFIQLLERVLITRLHLHASLLDMGIDFLCDLLGIGPSQTTRLRSSVGTDKILCGCTAPSGEEQVLSRTACHGE